MLQFQSSPRTQAGCNADTLEHWRNLKPFQSSPRTQAGCNTGMTWPNVPALDVSILTPHSGGVQPSVSASPLGVTAFQSSPRTQAGCNHLVSQGNPTAIGVSILTPHSGGVQRSCHCLFQRRAVVSILTPHSGGVQRLTACRCAWPVLCFNPHPALRRGATPPSTNSRNLSTGFQSSPRTQAGCNPRRRVPTPNVSLFQSSPRTQAGCN